jgi:hypothetical protein
MDDRGAVARKSFNSSRRPTAAVVLNLGWTDVTRQQVEELLRRKPVAGL